MITAPGAYPEDCCRAPQYPLTPQITLTVEQRGTDLMGEDTNWVEAWAVGNDCSRCILRWTVPVWMVTAYPEMWAEGLRRLVAGVQWEMKQAGIWEPKPETLNSPPQAGHGENAVHCPHEGPVGDEKPGGYANAPQWQKDVWDAGMPCICTEPPSDDARRAGLSWGGVSETVRSACPLCQEGCPPTCRSLSSRPARLLAP